MIFYVEQNFFVAIKEVFATKMQVLFMRTAQIFTIKRPPVVDCGYSAPTAFCWLAHFSRLCSREAIKIRVICTPVYEDKGYWNERVHAALAYNVQNIYYVIL